MIVQRQPSEPETAILRARADAAERMLQDFAYAVSHDLGAPLRAVTGFSSILQQRYAHELDDKGRYYLKFVSEGGDRAQQMLAALLQYSRIHTLAKSSAEIDLSLLLEVVLFELDEKLLAVDAVVESEPLPAAWGDDDQIKTLLHVLIDNAATYHRPGGSPHIVVVANEDDDKVTIRVIDNGTGIEADKIEQAFKIFKRLNSNDETSGLGMGLPIARRIVERHGGVIGVDPALPHGASVWFTLPKPKREMILNNGGLPCADPPLKRT